MKYVKSFGILMSLVELISSANIFVMVPTASFSHQQFYRVYTRELHKRGHNITVATANPIRDPNITNNYREIDMSYQYEYVKKLLAEASNGNSVLRILPELFFIFGSKIVLDTCQMSLQDDKLMSIYRNNEQFDLIVFEWGIHFCFFPFEKLSAGKYIGIGSYAMGALTLFGMGNPANPAYFPDYSLSYTDHLNFFQRVRMSLFTWVCSLFFASLRRRENEMARKYFGPDARPLWEIENDVTLVFENTHPLVTYPKPNNLNLIPIGGPPFHLFGRKPQKLPKDVQDFMNDAKDGVIYFSLGSNVKTGNGFDKEEKILIDCFSKLKQKVLWKWENENLKVNLKNVKLSKWFPQVDILAHPNTKAFITQGGLQSVGEAVAYHVPLIIMPFFADQGFNAKKMESVGAAIIYDFDDLSVEGLSKALHEIIYNTTYKENIIKLSNLVKDQPMHPLDKAIWWTEYVIRHNGAPHLRSVAATMPWYQYFMLDVLAAFFLLLFIISYVAYKIISLLIKSTCKKGKSKKD